MQILEELIPAQRRIYGEEDVQHTRSLFDLFLLHQEQGHMEEAEKLAVPLLQIRERVLGTEHPFTLYTRELLADCLAGQGKLDEAEIIMKEIISVRERTLGPEHPHNFIALDDLGRIQQRQGALNTAHDTYWRAVSGQEKHVDETDPDYLINLTNLAGLYEELNEISKRKICGGEVLTVDSAGVVDTLIRYTP